MGALVFLITSICAMTSGDYSDCDDALVNLSPCLDYVTEATDFPSHDCCEQLPTVCRAQSTCFCAFIDGTTSNFLGTPIDTDRAINLSDACDDGYDSETSGVRPSSVSDTSKMNRTTSRSPNLRPHEMNHTTLPSAP